MELLPERMQLLLLRGSVYNQTDVSWALTKHVISAHAKDANFVFSPLSLHVLLGLIGAGSNGPTRDQLLGFLKSKSTEELNSLSSKVAREVLADGEALGGPRLSFANGVWVDRSVALKPDFKQIADKDYMAASTNVDFQNKAEEVIKEVNAWAAKKTNGLIKQLLPPDSVDASTMLILANAVYFKGVWEEKYNTSLTKHHDFFLLNGSSVQTPFMTSSKRQSIRAFDGFKVLRMSYKQRKDDNLRFSRHMNAKDDKRIFSMDMFLPDAEDKCRFSMYIFLPDAKDGLPSLIEKIISEPGFMEHHLPNNQVKVNDFRIPRFKIGFDFEASEVLKAQGVVLPFTMGGLSEMADDPSVGELLYVSKIFHKSFIEVNEEGTEAAAFSFLTMPMGGVGPRNEEPLDFVADHPFVFVIREDLTAAVLFIGQLVNPLAR